VVAALSSSAYTAIIKTANQDRWEKTDRWVALLGFVRFPGKDDELFFVGLEPFDIQLLPFLAEIPSSVVHGDAETLSLLPPDTGLLQLCESESTSFPKLAVISDSLSSDCRTKLGERAYTEAGCFGLASSAAPELASRLIKPGFHAALPVLAEVVRVKNVAEFSKGKYKFGFKQRKGHFLPQPIDSGLWRTR
jgi:hypothetical protein